MSKIETSKPGKFGTLHLYQVAYRCDCDHDNKGTSRVWAYDMEHAAERFYDWQLVSVTKVPESGNMRKARPVSFREW